MALREAGWPCLAVTHYVDRPQLWWRRLVSAAGKAIGADLDREFRRRQLKSSPWTAIESYPLWELLRIAALRAGADARLVDMVFHRGIHSLERRAIRAFDASTTHVYCYEYSAQATFEAATQRGIRKVYEVPSTEYDFVEQLLAAEMRNFPELKSRATPYFHKVRAERAMRRRREWQLADLVVVNSTFTRKTFAEAGLDTRKVVVVPYGAPPVAPHAARPASVDRPFRFLWAGTFSIRKGAHHLLEAWRLLRDATDVELHIYGAWDLPDRLRAGLSPAIHFHGAVPQTELFNRYAEADVLVFPTLCDGFGMVVTEAFAHGLPVITTDRAGAADIVRHGENGLIVPGGDIAALAAAMDWCISHRAELLDMRPKALETAANRPWAAYRTELADAIRSAFGVVRSQG